MKIDRKRFWPTLLIIVTVLTLTCVKLEAVQKSVSRVYAEISRRFGWFFVLSGIAALMFSVWIIFSKYGKIRLGSETEQPAYSRFAWTAMMITTGCSAGLMIMGFVESISYVSSPPWHAEPFSVSAYEYAGMYTHYHWGFMIFALYVPISVAICYLMHNRRRSVAGVSVLLEEFGKSRDHILSRILDVVAAFGVIMAPVPSMGIGVPVLARLLQEIIGFSDSMLVPVQYIVLGCCVLLFCTSVLLGLDRGIKNLSNLNIILAFTFMGIVFLFANPVHVLESEINGLGLYMSNFVHLLTYTDPYGDGAFFRDWTVWMIAWTSVYIPLMGIFNARISRGRTLREVALAQMVGMSIGCWICPMTIGNFTLNLQKSGTVDLATIYTEQGQAETVIAALKAMPIPVFMMAFLIVICFVFMATTMDSSAFVAAEMTTRHFCPEDHSSSVIRLIWALISAVTAFVLLRIGGFTAIQTLAIIMGLPMCILMLISIFVVIRMLRKDKNDLR